MTDRRRRKEKTRKTQQTSGVRDVTQCNKTVILMLERVKPPWVGLAIVI